MILPYRNHLPRLGTDVFVASSAAVIGRVQLGDRASVWFGAVLRGDVDEIVVGEESNLQDLCVLHATGGESVCRIGRRVTVGHRAILHGCIVEDGSLVGMGSVLLDNARIGAGSLVAAGSVVLQNAVVPPHSLVAGVPAEVKGTLSEDRARGLLRSAAEYVELAREYRESKA
jgi:carbonic anhydrase/acetyltransferase-like protein (isoleucine patch superfamily)